MSRKWFSCFRAVGVFGATLGAVALVTTDSWWSAAIQVVCLVINVRLALHFHRQVRTYDWWNAPEGVFDKMDANLKVRPHDRVGLWEVRCDLKLPYGAVARLIRDDLMLQEQKSRRAGSYSLRAYVESTGPPDTIMLEVEYQ